MTTTQNTNNMNKETDINRDEMKIYFQSTEKNSKEYNYREHVWDLTNQLDRDEYFSKCPYDFKYGGYLAPWPDEKDKGDKKTVGYKIMTTEEFKNAEQLLYIATATVNNKEKILKGGKVKGKLPSRTYSAGTEDNWTMRGTCSPTNYIYSQIFRMCIKEGIPIKFYIFVAPLSTVSWPSIFGGNKTCSISPYEEMEKDLNAHLKHCLGGKSPIGEGQLDVVLNKN